MSKASLLVFFALLASCATERPANFDEEILFKGSLENFNVSGQSLLYKDAVKAASKRSSMRINPDNPCYALI